MKRNLLNLIVMFLTILGWSQNSSEADSIITINENKISTKTDLNVPGEYGTEVYNQLAGDTDAINDSKSITIKDIPNHTTNVMGTFDGLDDFMLIDHNSALNLTNNYTFEAWVNQEESTGFGGIIDKGSVQLFIHNKTNLTSYNENSLVLSIATAKGAYVINTKKNSIKQNSWHHIVYRVSTTNIYKIYIDGVSVPFTTTGTAGAATSNVTSPAYIGNNPVLTGGLKGAIDEIRIWTGVRSQAVIKANAMTKYIGNELKLKAYYPFSEGDNKYVHDYSINDNTAVVTNADTDGIGEDKFWNVPVLLQKIEFVNQLSSSYDATTKTYTILLKKGTDITTAVAKFSLNMQSIAKINSVTQKSGNTKNDYTNPVTFTVEGVGFNTGIIEAYTLNIIGNLNTKSKLLSYDFKTASNPELTEDINAKIVGNTGTIKLSYEVNLSNLIADFTVSPGAELYIDGLQQLNSKTNSFDYAESFQVTVISEDKLSQTNYTIILDTKPLEPLDTKSSETNIIAYSVVNQLGTSVINQDLKTIQVFVDNNANLSALIPSFQISDFATLRMGTHVQNSGVTTLNYILPVVYNVTAQNGTIENWTVIIEKVKPIITLVGNSVVYLNKGCPYFEAGYTTKDNLDVDISTEVLISGTVDVDVPGEYTLSYSIKDALNKDPLVTRTIKVLTSVCALSINKNEIKGFVVYPNPVKDGKLYIEAASTNIKNVMIFDLTGKMVFRIETEHKELNILRLSAGAYIIKVEQDGNTYTKKLLIE
ncbi:DUF5011 domain-containing protein [Flavobacterium branchiarum]|uniref:LamG-like jellyroll fold domain-containing protein n=1 Tax=Flavobacterium branchiarum TaxID=1114870 RepID=A0ABV5FML6_9FLAO|nr:LamG-like jellyroll fold domain-containing protein [Flavobacterium branchiarum]MDN3674319.1 DUF5011 domain-containing protein [Flavobacterium branchiarum]